MQISARYWYTAYRRQRGSQLNRKPAPIFESADVAGIARTLLKDDTADLLRDYIISGRLLPGARLAERQLAEALGISRMPIRDALIKLEEKGLVVSRPTGRYVIEVSKDEIRQLMQVRSTLEALATELAAQRVGSQGRSDMQAALGLMRTACKARDRVKFTRADISIHEAIWRSSENKYVQQALSTILGPLLVAISSSVDAFDWTETLEIHEDLLEAVWTHNTKAALEIMARHMDSIVNLI